MKKNSDRYSPFLRYSHWITFALVALAYATINARKLFPRGSPERLLSTETHFWLGIAVLVITVPRIVARLRQRAPAIAPPQGTADRIAAGTAHVALFVFLVVQPILGIVARMATGRGIGIPLTDLAIPSLMVADKAFAKSVEHLHVFVGEAFYYVIGVHILAALWHWLARRDNVLQRMV